MPNTIPKEQQFSFLEAVIRVIIETKVTRFSDQVVFDFYKSLIEKYPFIQLMNRLDPSSMQYTKTSINEFRKDFEVALINYTTVMLRDKKFPGIPTNKTQQLFEVLTDMVPPRCQIYAKRMYHMTFDLDFFQIKIRNEIVLPKHLDRIMLVPKDVIQIGSFWFTKEY